MYGHHTPISPKTLFYAKKDRATTQVSGHWSLTGQARVKTQAVPCGICGRRHLRVLSFSHASIIHPKTHCQSHFYNRRHIICQTTTYLNNTSKVKRSLWKFCTALSWMEIVFTYRYLGPNHNYYIRLTETRSWKNYCTLNQSKIIRLG